MEWMGSPATRMNTIQDFRPDALKLAQSSVCNGKEVDIKEEGQEYRNNQVLVYGHTTLYKYIDFSCKL